MLKAHKIELIPNNKQATYFAKSSGVARFAYNWALAEWGRAYEAGEKPNEAALRRKLNSIKREQFPWMLEVTKNAPQMAIIQLGVAFKNFFRKTSAYPRFRKKGIDDRFSLSNDQFVVNGCRIRIPHLGWVRMREALRFVGKIVSATISRRAGRWFVSITVELPEKTNTFSVNENQVTVGVDVGITHIASLSTGEKIVGPKPYRQLLSRVKRLSKGVSRKQKGSKNRNKARMKLAKLHYRISNQRQETIHQLTNRLTKHFSTIVIEDLNVKGMMKNRRLSCSLADSGFHEFRRQLEYKTKERGKTLMVADRWFPSSKRCSDCNYLLSELSLSIREWRCPQCNVIHDRDINAAKNLVKWAVSSTASACGAPANGVAA